MSGLLPARQSSRDPYTPERVIIALLDFKCGAPKASDYELSRVVYSITGHRLHNETVKSLLGRFFFWSYEQFRIPWPISSEPKDKKQEIVKLRQAGWSDRTIAYLLHCSTKTVTKWWRRFQQSLQVPDQNQPSLWWEELSRAPYHTQRKVYIGTIHAVLKLQKKYGYAGWFRIQGYLEKDYGIKLGTTTIKKIMALNRHLHLAPQREIEMEERETREGPKKSRNPFEHIFVDFRYLDAKPQGVQLYSTLLIEGLSRSILAGSLTTDQDAGVLLHVYFQGLLKWGLWDEVISDHGGQFKSLDWIRVNKRLGIHHEMYDMGKPWKNLIESQFGIQARVGESHWEPCKTVDEAVEFHRDLIHVRIILMMNDRRWRFWEVPKANRLTLLISKEPSAKGIASIWLMPVVLSE